MEAAPGVGVQDGAHPERAIFELIAEPSSGQWKRLSKAKRHEAEHRLLDACEGKCRQGHRPCHRFEGNTGNGGDVYMNMLEDTAASFNHILNRDSDAFAGIAHTGRSRDPRAECVKW